MTPTSSAASKVFIEIVNEPEAEGMVNDVTTGGVLSDEGDGGGGGVLLGKDVSNGLDLPGVRLLRPPIPPILALMAF